MVKAAMSFLLPSPANAAADTDGATTTGESVLAGIRKRKGARKRRRGVPAAAAGIVVLFSALCATLLWVGVGSFSPRPAAAGAGSPSARGRGSEVRVCIFCALTRLRARFAFARYGVALDRGASVPLATRQKG